MASDEEFLQTLRQAFVAEAQEQVESISSGLARLQNADDPARKNIIENTFREVHNLKGSARALNLLNLESVCQSLEDIFSELKRGARIIDSGALDLLHEVVDSVSTFLTRFESNFEYDGADLFEKAKSRLVEGSSSSDASAIATSNLSSFAPDSTALERDKEESAAEDHQESESLLVDFYSWQADRVSNSAEEKRQMMPPNQTELEPPSSDWDTPFNALDWDNPSIPATTLNTDAPSSASTTDVSVPPTSSRFANPLLDDFAFPLELEKPASQTVAPSAVPIDANKSEIVRIPAGRLDELLMRAEDMLSLKIMSRQHNQDLNNVGFKFDSYNREWTKIVADVRAARQLIDRHQASPEELIIENVLSKVLDFLDQQQQHLSSLGSQLNTLKSASLNDYRSAAGTVDTFLENTKKLLMMPASTTLELMPKLVRDLARELGKEVDLTISGSTIQLDKRVLNQLKDPLIHILRNSIDHGLEKPEIRLAEGKSRRGSINIGITPHAGNTVEITISDDGAGINVERIKAVALERELIDKASADSMTDDEAISLIFHSSFSTSATINEISGRGLGMAIAKENITNLGGKLVIETEKGRGTIFRITLPMTIATFRGVLVKCGSETLVVPTSDMDRVVRVKPAQIQAFDGGQTILIEGKPVNLSKLDSLLELPTATRKLENHLIMVLKTGETIHAFEVDDVLEEQEILVKKLTKPIVRVKNIAGVTILGTGRPAVILNVRDLMKSATRAARLNQQSAPTAAVVEARQQRILVVDDTITARILMKNILESAGYLVKTAKDGAEALKTLNAESFDMVVTDIEMPKMTGIELTSAVRKDSNCKDIPIILVTSMTDQESRDKGTEAGANAFFVKSSFDQNNLVDVIKKLI